MSYISAALITLLSVAPAGREQLKFPITSMTDSGTVRNEQMAQKARRLATYVITRRDKCPRSYDSRPYGYVDPKSQDVQVTFNYKGQTYRIIVSNTKNGGCLTLDLKDVGSSTTNANLIDAGFDGRVDSGLMSGDIPGNPSPTYSAWYPNSAGPSKDVKARFQRVYGIALDNALAFYERPSRHAAPVHRHSKKRR